MVILELIHAKTSNREVRLLLLEQKLTFLVTLDNFVPIARSRTGDVSFKCLPYQLSMVGYMPTMVVTGNGESGFDSGEGA